MARGNPLEIPHSERFQLGLREWLEDQGHEYIVTGDKEGSNSAFQKHITDAEILITTPFHPGYLTRDLVEKAKNLKLCVTAGVGSDHIDLDAAVDHKIQVLEVSGSNVTSVAEHVVMSILLLVRNFVPAHEMVERGDWDVSQIARNAFDLEGKVVGTLGAGRIGSRVLQRLKPFECKELLYYDYNPLPEDIAAAVDAKRIVDLKVRCCHGQYSASRGYPWVGQRRVAPPFQKGRMAGKHCPWRDLR